MTDGNFLEGVVRIIFLFLNWRNMLRWDGLGWKWKGTLAIVYLRV
jgi:hypothetical protein